jgi:hypothetical protein
MTMKKLSSVTTTLPMASSLPSGSQHTATGVVALDQAASTAALETLKHQPPSDTNRALRSSLEQLGLYLTPNIDSNYEITSYLIKSTTPDLLQGQCAKGLRIIAKSMVPLPIEEMEKALLTSSMLMTKSPGETPEDLAMRCQLYAAQMHDWPADIFLKTCEVVVRNHKWWPAFSDFQREYNWMIKARLRMQETLQKCMIAVD